MGSPSRKGWRVDAQEGSRQLARIKGFAKIFGLCRADTVTWLQSRGESMIAFWTRTTWIQHSIGTTATKSFDSWPSFVQKCSNTLAISILMEAFSLIPSSTNRLRLAWPVRCINRSKPILSYIRFMQRPPDIASMCLRRRRPWLRPACTSMSPRYPQDYYWWNHELDWRPLSHV